MAAGSKPLRIAVTGAAGFIGRAVVDLIERGDLGDAVELRLNDLDAIERPGVTAIQGSFTEAPVRQQLVGDGLDVLFHLASLPGGASERDPALGRRVNLDGSLALLDAVAREGGPVVVYASSIATLGAVGGPVGDATALRPQGGYGTHKAMVELYLADLTRRGLVDGRAVRPSGIVARPRGAYAGFATAWMSELFRAAVDHQPVVVAARPDTRIWLQSIDTVAANIVHAATLPAAGLPAHRAWTLPASVVRIDALVAALGRRTGHALEVDYRDGPIDQHPLDAAAALAAGFVDDGDIHSLIATVVGRIERE